jgi:hypothetical protein
LVYGHWLVLFHDEEMCILITHFFKVLSSDKLDRYTLELGNIYFH